METACAVGLPGVKETSPRSEAKLRKGKTRKSSQGDLGSRHLPAREVWEDVTSTNSATGRNIEKVALTFICGMIGMNICVIQNIQKPAIAACPINLPPVNVAPAITTTQITIPPVNPAPAIANPPITIPPVNPAPAITNPQITIPPVNPAPAITNPPITIPPVNPAPAINNPTIGCP